MMAVLRTYKDGVLVSEEVIEDAPPETEEPPAEGKVTKASTTKTRAAKT